MQRERVTEDIFVFTSDLYAQVTAGLVLTSEGAVVIDTLAYPQEAKQIRRFVEERLNTQVRYVVNTHFHADHTTGNCYFPGVKVIAHELCRKFLDERGRENLEQFRSSAPEMQDVQLVLPDVLFNERLTLHLGGKTLAFWASPGHSADSIVCLVKEDQVLFGADTCMSLPYFVDGDYEALLRSIEALKHHNLETIVQGHGEVILRGEIEEKLQSDIDYLVKLRDAVAKALASDAPTQALQEIDIETCGKSRILLNGVVEQLHRQNVASLAERMAGQGTSERATEQDREKTPSK